jgi:5'-3' exonuclease
MKYLLVDLANGFFRARHVAHRGSELEERVAFAIHVALASIQKAWRDQKADHVVFCLEGRSWRKDYYKPYKANRAEARAAQTEKEQEEDKAFWGAFDDLQQYLMNNTCCTVLQHKQLEADDLIAGWIQTHPNDHHVIVSSDSDFHQLLASNVEQYNGVADELHTINGIYDKKGKPVLDKKTKEPKTIPDPEWILFEKIMRGDPTDNIFSAYPGVRTKGSKTKVGLTEAYEDRHKQGFAWNNLMLQRWTDHNGIEHKVLDDYHRNRVLVDLKAQPDDIKEIIIATITEASTAKLVAMVGAKFLKYCGKYNLVKLSEQATQYAEMLNSTYPESETSMDTQNFLKHLTAEIVS